MKITSRIAVAALLGTVALPAFAADLPKAGKAPFAPVMEAPSPWMIRVRALAVVPRDKASVNVATVGNGLSGLDVSNSVVPELDITYFFTKNIAAELILGTTPHDIKGKDTLSAVGKVGRTWLLPPTLTLQYHFTDFGAFKPYVGAGVNYTFFYGNENKGAFTAFKVKNQAGFALQAGFDYMIDRHWGINFDVKKLWLRPDAEGIVGGNAVKAKVNLDPWIIGAGVTYRF